ncbi:sensor histidine kinase [Cohnella endophytica]|uniref:histidine kinase n=1 Tax=Cohnella endophytica TaxID=2419778 RepID=A0A494XTS3_9BACL|nr:HAMP domain-containing sensor histidine kinase [Cohnella endophytica]RKP53988.1 sensor histidine kinase [Cohnella endophytica]
MSIRLRLTLWYSGLLAVALIAFGIIIYGIVQRNTMGELKDQLKQVSRATEMGLTRDNELQVSLVPPRGITFSNIYIQVVNYMGSVQGTVSTKSNNMRPSPQRDELTFPHSRQDEIHYNSRFVNVEVEGAPFLIMETAYKYQDNVVALLQTGVFSRSEMLLLSRLRTIIWFSGVAGVIAAFLLGMFLSRKALQPINRVTQAAERIQSGLELGIRIPREKANDEIGRLTDTLNGMLTGLECAYKTLEDSNTAQRRFVSDASHELRTPLTTIRGNVDLLEKIWQADERFGDGIEETEDVREGKHVLSEEEKREMSLESIRDIADEARRMSGLVNDLLALARADAGYSVEMESVPLKALAEEAARRAAFLPRKAEWHVGPIDALEDVEVWGNRDYLLQLLFILIENGFKYTPAGSVRLYATKSGNSVGLSVADTGIGIGAEEVPHIFERFYRVDVSRGETSGTGLGLSIAKWIADLHHGKFEVMTRLGEGTVFTLWLPIIAKKELA